MRKAIVFAVLVLCALLLAAQEQEPQEIPVQPDEQAQVQAEEPAPPPPAIGREVSRLRIPRPFIHAGKEYPAGDYWLALASREGSSYFTVQNESRNPLFEELAIAKARSGSGLRLVSRAMTGDQEFYRIKVAAPGEWLYVFFLVKK